MCERCGADLHTCSNCSYFDTASLHQCRKSLDEPVASKTRANRCPHFAPARVQEFAGEGRAGGGGSSPRDAFDSLFKKG